MTAAKFSVSVTPELELALRALATRRGEDRSRLIETLLRENPLVGAEIGRLRGADGGPPGLKKGRSIEEIRVLVRLARRRWERRTQSGQVRIVATKP
jgi:predicted transcriptional regulator